jgi:type VI secretion system secreted protein VgrG
LKTDFVQSGGFLTIDTPFGANDLLLDGLEGAEGISELFKFNLFMRSGSTNLSASTIVGKNVTVTLEVEGGTKRYIHGIVSRFIQSGYDVDFATYQAELVPSLWLLSLSRDRKIYQTKYITNILKQILTMLELYFIKHKLVVVWVYIKNHIIIIIYVLKKLVL